MASGRMAPSNAKSGRNVDPTLRPDSRLAFRRQVRQTHGTHGTQGIIFADESEPVPPEYFHYSTILSGCVRRTILPLENLSASGEPFCVHYLLSPWLRLVRPGGMDPYPHAPNKRLDTQDASLRSLDLDRRTHREHGACLSVTSFFLRMSGWPAITFMTFSSNLRS